MKDSKIEWTDSTWNPVTGCTKVSPGCKNCYAEQVIKRSSKKVYPNGFDVTLKPHRMNDPIKWKKPKRIFVNSLSDLFHEDIPDEFLFEAWYVMAEVATWHVYQILTKRPQVMAERIERLGLKTKPHIWLGTSVENQEYAERRIPALVSIPGINRFLSCEPLLDSVDLSKWACAGLHWIITGGESGGHRRRLDYDWVRQIRDFCLDNEIPYFHKQGSHFYPGRDRELDGRTWDEYPESMGGMTEPRDLRIEAKPSDAQLALFG